jgi:hypothetical protein
MLERLADARRIAARACEARSRKRRKAGRLILSAEIDEVGLIEALIEAGYLALADAGDRELVRVAMQGVLDDFIARWRMIR